MSRLLRMKCPSCYAMVPIQPKGWTRHHLSFVAHPMRRYPSPCPGGQVTTLPEDPATEHEQRRGRVLMADHKATIGTPSTSDPRQVRCATCGERIQRVLKPRGERSQAEQAVFMSDPANWYWKHRDPRSQM